MPYIDQNSRKKFNDILEDIKFEGVETAGELNYLISKICLIYIERHGKRYQYLNDIMGALTGVQLELYRRVTAPYEDLKIAESGDIL